MEIKIKNKKRTVDSIQVYVGNTVVELFVECGKLFARSTQGIAPVNFAPDTVCLNYAGTSENAEMKRRFLNSTFIEMKAAKDAIK